MFQNAFVVIKWIPLFSQAATAREEEQEDFLTKAHSLFMLCCVYERSRLSKSQSLSINYAGTSHSTIALCVVWFFYTSLDDIRRK